MKYRKKPVVIEAKQLTADSFEEVALFIGDKNIYGTNESECSIEIVTLEGNHYAKKGDFIIKGIAGEFYPCKQDIFAATYELVEKNKDTQNTKTNIQQLNDKIDLLYNQYINSIKITDPEFKGVRNFCAWIQKL